MLLILLMLEDEDDRVRRFTAVLRRIAPDLRLILWRDAHLMCREVGPYLPDARLLSLDHDLDPPPGESSDPGDDLIVAKSLVNHPQPCPVLIHSSKVTRSDWMAGEFELAGWNYRRVAPIGERWIEEYWQVVVRELLARPPAGPSRRSVTIPS